MRLLLLLIPAIAVAEPPTPVVTKAFMRKAQLAVDPEVGLVVIDYITDEREPIVRSAKRLCAADADAHIKLWTKNHLRPALRLDELFTCTNRPRPTCVVGFIGEGTTKTTYELRPLPDGTLVLDTMITTDSTYEPADTPRVVARLRAKLLGGRCS